MLVAVPDGEVLGEEAPDDGDALLHRGLQLRQQPQHVRLVVR